MLQTMRERAQSEPPLMLTMMRTLGALGREPLYSYAESLARVVIAFCEHLGADELSIEHDCVMQQLRALAQSSAAASADAGARRNPLEWLCRLVLPQLSIELVWWLHERPRLLVPVAQKLLDCTVGELLEKATAHLLTSFTHSLTHPLACSLTHSPTHPLPYLRTRPLAHSLARRSRTRCPTWSYSAASLSGDVRPTRRLAPRPRRGQPPRVTRRGATPRVTRRGATPRVTRRGATPRRTCSDFSPRTWCARDRRGIHARDCDQITARDCYVIAV